MNTHTIWKTTLLLLVSLVFLAGCSSDKKETEQRKPNKPGTVTEVHYSCGDSNGVYNSEFDLKRCQFGFSNTFSTRVVIKIDNNSEYGVWYDSLLGYKCPDNPVYLCGEIEIGSSWPPKNLNYSDASYVTYVRPVSTPIEFRGFD